MPSRVCRTCCMAIRLNCLRSSLYILAASTLAGLSTLGSASMLITERRMLWTLCTGLQRSLLFS